MSIADRPLARQPVHPVLWGLVAIMVGFEVMFWAVERGILPPGLGRIPIYGQFAFFDSMFDFAREEGKLPPQLLWSFLTHGLLHGGWLHLGLNGAAFLGLGHAVTRFVGIGGFLVILAGSTIAGALVFGLIAETYAPLVGASGAIFGLLAAITAWQERALRLQGLSRKMIWQRIAGLAVLNVVMFAGLGGMIAWEAHLGGFLAGWALALVYRPDRRPA